MVAEFLINFSRLRIGILLYILGMLSMFIIDISGHATNHSSRVECIFNFSYNGANRSFDIPYFGMHWEVCIPTNFFLELDLLWLLRQYLSLFLLRVLSQYRVFFLERTMLLLVYCTSLSVFNC